MGLSLPGSYRINKARFDRDDAARLVTHIQNNSCRHGWKSTIRYAAFKLWYEAQLKQCEYCGKSDLSRDKFKKLTVDRKNNDKPYTFDNIVLACWTCNRLKNDYFTYEEFKEIAHKYITPRVR